MSRTLNLGIVSSIVPKKCGIATFGQNLMDGMRLDNPGVSFIAIAAEEPKETYDYSSIVRALLKTNNRNSYNTAARLLNNLPLDALLLQHEYGLYGGTYADFTHDGIQHHDQTGDYILDLLQKMTVPVITTLHTVLPHPDRQRRSVIQDIARLSKRIVTMTRDSRRLLTDEFDIPAYKIAVVPHGVPAAPLDTRMNVRSSLGLDPEATYMTVTGLIGPNKGIDLIIKALPGILERNPQVRLLVVGQTHPNILALEGESYRESLMTLAEKLGVGHAIQFVNKYVATGELMRYLLASDIYLTIHGDPEQAASGTLAYAVGTGLPSIATPYRYAKEVLSAGRGLIVPFNDAAAITAAVNNLVEDDALCQDMKEKLRAYGKKMAWPTVAKSYLKIVRQVTNTKIPHEHTILR